MLFNPHSPAHFLPSSKPADINRHANSQNEVKRMLALPLLELFISFVHHLKATFPQHIIAFLNEMNSNNLNFERLTLMPALSEIGKLDLSQ